MQTLRSGGGDDLSDFLDGSVEFEITFRVKTSPAAHDILKRAMSKRGFRFQLRFALGQAIENVLSEWGFPVLKVYQVIEGSVER